jgi:uncharacterized protein YndB with AHSA1/START domain
MTTKVEKSIDVDAPLRTVYNQWTQFEEFPRFMGGVQQVRQLGDSTLHWVAEIGGVKREWTATILEQVPDERIAWAATEGATNAGAVRFVELGPTRTTVLLTLEYEPEGVVENVGDTLGIVGRQAEGDLERFKAFIEARGAETGQWRGSVDEGAGVGTPGVEAAALSEGDSGKAGVSAKAVAAGAAAAVAGVAAAKALGGDSGSDQPAGETVTPVEPVAVTSPVAAAPVADGTPADSYPDPAMTPDPVLDDDVTRRPL